MSGQTNSSPAKKNSAFMETVQDKLKDIKNFSNLSAKEQMIAVGAVGVMVGVLLPFVAVALPVAATGVIVALTLFFAVKAVEYTFKGLKWSAEKTVEGAKYIGGKIRDGAVYSKNKVKEGYEYSAASLERGVSFVGEKVKKGASRVTEAAANKLYNGAGSENYSDRINDELVPDSSQRKKIQEIKGDLKAIFADKGNNSGLVKNILSGISSKIDLKMAEEAKSGRKEHTPKWQAQKEFIHNLNEKSLYSLLTKRSLPKYRYFIDSVFSDHYDEIKEVIKECKESHLYSSVSNMFNKAEKRANRPSFKSLTRSISSSLSSLRRGNSEQSNSLPRSSSLDSIGTVSTATVSGSGSKDFAIVNPNRLSRSSSSSSLTSKLTPVASPKVPGSPSTDSGRGLSDSSTPSEYCTPNASGVSTPIGNRFSQGVNSEVLKRRLERLKSEPVKQKRDFTSSDFHDSGRGSSGSSTPKSPFVEDLSKARAELKKTGYLDKWVGQPSTKVDEVKPESTQVKTVG
jgi:hypothetical protein